MEYEQPMGSPSTNVPPPSTVPASPVQEPKNNLIAPLWNTALIVALLLGNSFLGSAKMGGVHGSVSRILLYSGTFITELLLFLLVWWGIHLRGVRMRDLIGGKWETVESFLLDVAIAAGFWFIALMLLFVVRVAVGSIDLHNMKKSTDDAVRMLGPLAPHSYLEAAFFVCLSVAAGIFEEIIFRGYLQRQFIALSRSAVAGLIASGIIFGLAHGYQGWRMMIAIGFFGVLFGLLAYFRGSLRPGIMAHAFQDSLAGIALFYIVRR